MVRTNTNSGAYSKINSYLQPLVAELNVLWNDGISVKAHGSTANAEFHAALLCVGCDIPTAGKVCGFTGHGSNISCSKCKNFFPDSVVIKTDFLGFQPCPPRSDNEQTPSTGHLEPNNCR